MTSTKFVLKQKRKASQQSELYARKTNKALVPNSYLFLSTIYSTYDCIFFSENCLTVEVFSNVAVIGDTINQ